MVARHSASLAQGQYVSPEEARARLFNAQSAEARARLDNLPWAPGARPHPVIQGAVIPNPAEYAIHSDNDPDEGAPESVGEAEEVSPAPESEDPSI